MQPYSLEVVEVVLGKSRNTTMSKYSVVSKSARFKINFKCILHYVIQIAAGKSRGHFKYHTVGRIFNDTS